jgi:single-stranded-DNA-specific exonuclease
VTDSGKGRKVGEDKTHLRLTLNNSNKDLVSIGFGMGEDFDKITENKPFDICYSIDENTWKGQTSLQLRLKGIK